MSFTLQRSIKWGIILSVALMVIFLSYQSFSGDTDYQSEPLGVNTMVDHPNWVAKTTEANKPCVILFYTQFYRWNWKDPKATYTGNVRFYSITNVHQLCQLSVWWRYYS